MNKIIDISVSISPETPVYPGNPEVSFEKVSELPDANSTLSRIRLGAHTATHIDAPSHAIANSHNIDSFNLNDFIGQARVIDLTHIDFGGSIKIEDLESHDIQVSERILFKTKNSLRGYDEFYDDFIYLDGDAAEWLSLKDPILVGIDYLSIKQRGSSDNRSHTALLRKNIPILEGIDLREVEEGQYELVALPLKLVGLEASLTRAVLIQK